MKPTALLLPASLLLVTACSTRNRNEPESRKPNIIYILADDLGYGDISCYGQKQFTTPHLDQLAASGLKFTQHYAGSTVCAPSRCSLMTGLHTGHTFIRGNKETEPEGQYPLESPAVTIAEALKEAGYVTGAFGKWGLGYPGSEGDPLNQGFDVFFGYNCQRMAHHYYPRYVWHNRDSFRLEGNEGTGTGQYGPAVIHSEALKFLEINKDKPFFLYYPSLIPHAELFAPEAQMKRFRGRFEPEMGYAGVDGGEHFRTGMYGSQSEPRAAFAAMVTLLDEQVGELVAKLKELGIYENTIILFSSDNGPHREGGADPEFFNSNSIFRGFKRDLYEGGIRVPMIAVWDGMTKPGTETDHPSAFWDVFPTLAEIAGAKVPAGTDGISFLPTLLGKKGQKTHDYLYWEFHEGEGSRALRTENWKLIQNFIKDPTKTSQELYDLEKDPGEQCNQVVTNPYRVKRMTKRMNKVRTESEIFRF